jgi:peptidoglycan/LPS O-acetylase OafA/YrhL
VTRHSSFDRFAGEMSYPIYLSHLVVGAVLLKIGISTYYLSVVGLVICTVLGVALVRYVERPLTKLRHRLSHRPEVRPRQS